jgi:phosphatidylserine/phosphatidylglycerophosphate/cardiolipin synthase-like enzyme
MNNHPTKTRSVLIAVLGFWLGAVLGNLGTYLIGISGLAGWLLGLLPQDQPYVRLFFGILLAFVIIGSGGAVTGVINGMAISRIDTGGDRRRFLVGAGYAYGVGQGMLIIPVLLLISLIGIYNDGTNTQPQGYILLFGLFGLVYGLIVGPILSTLTINFKYMWGVLLAVVLGYLLGGVLLGLSLWWSDSFSLGTVSLWVSLALVIISLIVIIPPGILTGLAYHRLAERRHILGDEPLQPGRIQRIIVIGVSLVVLLTVFIFVQDAESFLTVRPAATATQLPLETIGVHWSNDLSQPDSSRVDLSSQPSISANSKNSVGIVWTQELDSESDVFYAFNGNDTDYVGWSEAINISNSSSTRSSNPQMVMDSNGQAHIVWEESDSGSDTNQIFYSRCQEADCLPPVLISTSTELACAPGLSGDNPSISIDASGGLMVAWSAGSGQLLYSTWPAGELPPQDPAGCIGTAENITGESLQTALTGGSEGVFAIAYTSGDLDESGDIYVQNYKNETWSMPGTQIGVGSAPDVVLDSEDQTHVAWCDESRIANYLYNGDPRENISSPTCIGRPELGLDSDGLPHLVWYSDQVENMNGINSAGKFLIESIRTGSGWSQPAIITLTNGTSQPAMASQPAGALHLTWSDTQNGSGTINYARQDPYQCEVDSLKDIGKVALNIIQNGGFHPSDYQVPYCNNQFVKFIYQPNPQPSFSAAQPTEYGGFDRVAEAITDTQYEVLFTNMQWDVDENNLSPGSTFARGVADLYQKVKENPSQYPRGMLVRILLGNYPEITTLEWGTQIWHVMNDLRDAGVEELENPDIGWKVEVADFAGTYPHSHSKFVIIDGKLLIGAGFNYSWIHLPINHPSGKGDDLTDLGTVVIGPAAQAAISAFDDMWLGANQLYCPDYNLTGEEAWSDSCVWQQAEVWHAPEVLKFYPADSQQNAFSLFRTQFYKEADDTYTGVLDSAQSSIDAIHVNFSLELICMLNVLIDDVCTFDNALPWMVAMMNAVEQKQVKTRLLLENGGVKGLENGVAIQVFQDELVKRGLEDLVEVRFFDGRVHMKTALIDQEFLIVGSQNFHYSSFGEKGLLEFVVASDDPAAIESYLDMFSYFWEQGIPVDEVN